MLRLESAVVLRSRPFEWPERYSVVNESWAFRGGCTRHLDREGAAAKRPLLTEHTAIEKQINQVFAAVMPAGL